jgi:hypothetical protein
MSAASAATEFEEQLKEVETQMHGISHEYADLCPKEQRECLTRLETTLKSLENIRAGLVDAQKKKADPDANVVQVTGFLQQGMEYFTALDLEASFMDSVRGDNFFRYHRNKGVPYTKAPTGISLVMENNYKINDKKQLWQVKECFLMFQTEEDAAYVLGLQTFHFRSIDRVRNLGFQATFAQPTQDFATRETLRKIGTLVDRLKEIENELLSIGAVRDGFSWKPYHKLIDKSFYMNDTGLPAWKRARAAGLPLDHNAQGILKTKKPVDMPRLQERINALSNEECDALIQLREFQLHGWDFDF